MNEAVVLQLINDDTKLQYMTDYAKKQMALFLMGEVTAEQLVSNLDASKERYNWSGIVEYLEALKVSKIPPKPFTSLEINKIKGRLKRCKEEITQIIHSNDEKGAIGNFRFQRTGTYRGGKQQSVYFLHLTFPDGYYCRLLEKRDPRAGAWMQSWQKKYRVIRETFPPILFICDRGFLTIAITGLEEGQVTGLIRDSEKYRQQLFQESWNMIDAVFKETPLMFNDMQPTFGHNIMFNLQTKKFQIFDLSCVKESECGFVEKHLRFMNYLVGNQYKQTSLSIEFLVYYVTQFHKRYPKTILEVMVPRRILKQGDRGYDEAYGDIYVARPPPSCREIFEVGGTKETINPEIETAIKSNDIPEIKRLLAVSKNKSPLLLIERYSEN